MKTHVYSFNKFNRVYEGLDLPEDDDLGHSKEEENLKDLLMQSTEALQADLRAGTADPSSYLKWVDTICDIAERTTMKGYVIDFAKEFNRNPDNIKQLAPIWKKLAEYKPGSAEYRNAEKTKERFTNAAKFSHEKSSKAEELLKKYGLGK